MLCPLQYHIYFPIKTEKTVSCNSLIGQVRSWPNVPYAIRPKPPPPTNRQGGVEAQQEGCERSHFICQAAGIFFGTGVTNCWTLDIPGGKSEEKEDEGLLNPKNAIPEDSALPGKKQHDGGEP